MIRRLFYMALGACLAIWTMRKLAALRPDHVARRAADRAVSLAGRLGDFAGDVRELSASRETELRAQFGLGSLIGVIGTVNEKHDDVKDGR